MTKIYFKTDHVWNQCGGRLIYGFNQHYKYSSEDNCEFKLPWKTKNYGKMIIATFNEDQKWAYDECCKHMEWLGQSRPIINPNSGNYIFTAVFRVV